MATNTAAKYVDHPEIRETFADSVRFVGFDGQTWRIELTVTRLLPEVLEKMPQSVQEGQELHPSCRLVLTMAAGLDLVNKLGHMTAALEKQGVLKKNEPPPQPFVMPEQGGPH